MKIDEAIDILEGFCQFGLEEWDKYKAIHEDIRATAVLICEYKQLKEANARLEAEVMALRDFKLREAME